VQICRTEPNFVQLHSVLKLPSWLALIARLDLIKLSLYIWLVIHPFEIINTQPSCTYWCLDFEISIGALEFCCLGGLGLVDGWKSHSEWHYQLLIAPSHILQAMQLCIFDWNRKSPSLASLGPSTNLSPSIFFLFLSSELCLSDVAASESDLGIDLV
jgi:hypothetical protein